MPPAGLGRACGSPRRAPAHGRPLSPSAQHPLGFSDWRRHLLSREQTRWAEYCPQYCPRPSLLVGQPAPRPCGWFPAWAAGGPCCCLLPGQAPETLGRVTAGSALCSGVTDQCPPPLPARHTEGLPPRVHRCPPGTAHRTPGTQPHVPSAGEAGAALPQRVSSARGAVPADSPDAAPAVGVPD